MINATFSSIPGVNSRVAKISSHVANHQYLLVMSQDNEYTIFDTHGVLHHQGFIGKVGYIASPIMATATKLVPFFAITHQGSSSITLLDTRDWSSFVINYTHAANTIVYALHNKIQSLTLFKYQQTIYLCFEVKVTDVVENTKYLYLYDERLKQWVQCEVYLSRFILDIHKHNILNKQASYAYVRQLRPEPLLLEWDRENLFASYTADSQKIDIYAYQQGGPSQIVGAYQYFYKRK